MRERFIIRPEKIHQSERGAYIGDLVYGANDGITTTFAVISGAAGATLSPGIIVILGLANLIADGISMGLSNYLSLRSKLDFELRERAQEEKEVREIPEKERKEVRDILRGWGVPERRLEETLVAITANKKRWVDLMMIEELGIIENKIDSPAKHGTMTSLAFILAGALPLIPYVFGVPPQFQFSVSLVSTAVALFSVGAARTLVTGTHWIRAGIQMLAVGGLAAIAAYGVGGAVKLVFGISA